jgi:hypothetical protein
VKQVRPEVTSTDHDHHELAGGSELWKQDRNEKWARCIFLDLEYRVRCESVKVNILGRSMDG